MLTEPGGKVPKKTVVTAKPKPTSTPPVEPIELKPIPPDAELPSADRAAPISAKPPVPLAGGGAGKGGLEDRWNSTAAADDPLPDGDYIAHAVQSTFIRSPKDGTEGLEVEFEVLEGDLAGRRFQHTFWLAQSNLKYSKAFLLKLGISDYDELHQPIPTDRVVFVHVVIHVTDRGGRFNRVIEMELLRIDPSLGLAE